MNIQTDRALIAAGKTTTRYLTVNITAPSRERQTERPAVHVALVLDRSGSMAGRKIEMAKKAVDHAVRLLNERDRLAVICYDTEIDTLLAATPATAEARKLALSRLRKVDARGGTDLCGGWLKGAAELTPPEDHPRDGQLEADAALHRVLLLSDGQANEGETDPGALARHAAALRARGIATSTLGLGADFDETLMSRLATEGGGHFYFIEQSAQIPDFLTSELGETLDVVAREARLVISGLPGIEIGCLNEFPVESHGLEVHVRLGDLVSAQELTVAVAVRSPAVALGDDAVVNVRLADRDHVLFSQPMSVQWRAVDETTDKAQAVDTAVIVEVATLLAARARADALEANRRGDYDRAKVILGTVAADLRALGPGLRQVEALAAELEAEQQEFGAVMSAMAMKASHFSSRNLMSGRTSVGRARKSG